MKRNLQTPVISKNEEKAKVEKKETELNFVRTKNTRGMSVGRTTTAQQPREITSRPATSQNIG